MRISVIGEILPANDIEALGSPSRNDFALPILTGVVFSHVFHLLSVIALYLCGRLLSIRQTNLSSIAFTAALLHILSPAGLFLSAPYAESLFSFLTFTGYWMYLKTSMENPTDRSSLRNVYTVLAGVVFGIATLIRSNGLLNGLIFLFDALSLLPTLLNGFTFSTFMQLGCLGVAGLSTILGVFIPQLIAYNAYCSDGSDVRPWCGNWVPSIYSWVQSHYW